MATVDPDAAMERVCPVLTAGAMASGRAVNPEPQAQGKLRCMGLECAWWGDGHCLINGHYDLLCEIRNYLSELPGTLKTIFHKWE